MNSQKDSSLSELNSASLKLSPIYHQWTLQSTFSSTPTSRSPSFGVGLRREALRYGFHARLELRHD